MEAQWGVWSSSTEIKEILGTRALGGAVCRKRALELFLKERKVPMGKLGGESQVGKKPLRSKGTNRVSTGNTGNQGWD